MNKFKRLVFSANPARLPALRPNEAAIWNQGGVWMADIGAGPVRLGTLINETLLPANVASTPHTVSSEEEVLIVDTDVVGGPTVINLLPAAQYAYRTLVVKKLGNAGPVDINADGAELIDDESSITIPNDPDLFPSVSLYSDSTRWIII